ncbi:serine/arginine-rich splicing factor 3 isoform X1 [Sminthopsis crassicaudata]|uniref:serine/arginine-rich splicing factor 3 isoform X1 n=1 Tax=Sminthopsis crassicaudata TaxID=9301 RepID=UPI003D6878D3
MHRDSCPLDCKVYVGNLGNNGNKTELERAFGYYGPLRSVWVARNPPGFAFVEFEDPRDAADAVRELDGRTLCGCRVRVELSNGEKRSRNRGPPPSWGRRPRDDYRRRSPPPRRRYFRIKELIFVSFTTLGPFQEIEEERDHCHGREIISLLVPFPGLAVALGQMKGNRTSAFKRSDVQEVALHLTGACTEHYKFCLSLHKLSAFLKCFSC